LKIWGRANSVNVQKSAVVLKRTLNLAYERIRCRHGIRRNSEPDYLAMKSQRRVPTCRRRFVLWESNSVMRYLVHRPYTRWVAALSAGAENGRQRRPLLDWGRFQRCRPVDRPCSEALVRNPVRAAGHGRESSKTPMAEAVQWSRRRMRTLANCGVHRTDDSASPISRSGPMQGRWFGVEGIQQASLPHLGTLVRAVFASRPGFPTVRRAADVRKPGQSLIQREFESDQLWPIFLFSSMISGQTLCVCPEGKSVSTFPDQALLRNGSTKARTLECHDTKISSRGDSRHHQPRRPAHARLTHPEQRATHQNGNDESSCTWLARCCSAPAAGATDPITDRRHPIIHKSSVPSTLTKPGRRQRTNCWRRHLSSGAAA